MDVSRLLRAYEIKVCGLPLHNKVMENHSTLRGLFRLEGPS